jgi:histidyl-tRNA synthetase
LLIGLIACPSPVMSSISRENKIGVCIREAREDLALTVEEFGSRYGLSGETVSQFEAGSAKPSLQIWLRIAHDLTMEENEAALLWVRESLPGEHLARLVERPLEAEVQAERAEASEVATAAERADEPESGLRLLKGTSDRLPEEQMIRERLTATLREVFELHGFAPAETPILHHFDILASKYAGGAEILKETYKLSDQGGRALALRYDLTVPFALMVGLRRDAIRLPFKRFEIGRVFRDGPVTPGRLREFYQCDADVSGDSSPLAEAELIALADMAFERMGVAARAEINHRGLLGALIESAEIEADRAADFILSLDKRKKIGPDKVREELVSKGFEEGKVRQLEAIMATVSAKGGESPKAMIASFREAFEAMSAFAGKAGALKALDELAQIFDALERLGVKLPVQFSPTLARGLTIYTGPVFEFFLQDQSLIKGSIAAGGRYDRIIGDFLKNQGVALDESAGPAFPTVGFSFGLEPLSEYLLSLIPANQRRHSPTEVLIVPIGNARDAALALAAQLRRSGVRTEVETRPVKMKKSFQRAESLGVPFVAVLGENEVAQGVAGLRDLAASQQENLKPEQIVERVQTWRGRQKAS